MTRVRVDLPRRFTVLGLAILLVLAGLVLQAVSATSAAAAPGSPGTPQQGQVIFQETFSNQDATDAAISIDDYQGGSAANDESYTADPAWTPGGPGGNDATCNGIILNSTTPSWPEGCGEAQVGWPLLQQMAHQIGVHQGMSAAEAAANQVLTAYTTGDPGAGYMLRTVNDATPAIAGHYYSVSALYAAMNCQRDVDWVQAEPVVRLELIVDGTTVVVGDDVNPCADDDSTYYPDGSVRVAEIVGQQAFRVDATGEVLGLRLYNKQADGDGNDGAFDLPTIVDVTPQLDKVFSTGSVAQGESTTVVFTITNTAELGAKADFGFADTLPDGVVASTGTTDCGDGELSVTDHSVSLTGGDLATDQASCTVTVTVTGTVLGTHVNTDVTTDGLLAPADAELTVTPKVAMSITKSTDMDTAEPGGTIDYSVVVANDGPSAAVGAQVLDPVPVQASSMTWTCTATEGASCTASGSGAIDDRVTVPSAGSVVYTVTVTLPENAIGELTNTATVVPPEGVTDDGCTPAPGDGCSASHTANVPERPRLALTTSASVTEVSETGEQIGYTYRVTNTGNVDLTDLAVADALTTGELTSLTVRCEATALTVGDSTTCSAQHEVTQSDLDAGAVVSAAFATATTADGAAASSARVGTKVSVLQQPSLTLTKHATVENGGEATVDGTIQWSFVVVNSGNVTITAVGVDDAAAGAVTCDESALAPGGSTTCRADDGHVVTDADAESGEITNTATATGTAPDGDQVTSAAVTVTVTVTAPVVETPDPVLADTGTSVPVGALAAGLVLLLAGGAALARRSR